MLLVLCYCWYSSLLFFFFFSSRRRHTRCSRDWSSDVCSSDLTARTRFWVPPPATTDSLFYLGISGGLGVFGFLHGDTRRVLERDIYEPNDTFPARSTWTPPDRSQTRTRCSIRFSSSTRPSRSRR